MAVGEAQLEQASPRHQRPALPLPPWAPSRAPTQTPAGRAGGLLRAATPPGTPLAQLSARHRSPGAAAPLQPIPQSCGEPRSGSGGAPQGAAGAQRPAATPAAGPPRKAGRQARKARGKAGGGGGSGNPRSKEATPLSDRRRGPLGSADGRGEGAGRRGANGERSLPGASASNNRAQLIVPG